MSDTDVTNPSYYKDSGPFECIELSRQYPSDWGQVIQYVWRHQHKNGLEDLRKALWFAWDAKNHGIDPNPSADAAGGLPAMTLLRRLIDTDHAGATPVWGGFYAFQADQIIDGLNTMITVKEDEA